MVINDPAVLAEVTSQFEAYEAALMANEVETLNGFFWRSDEVLRFGITENLYGYEAIIGFRKNRVGGSPQRILGRTVISTFGRDLGTANTEFQRIGGTRMGRQSQTWVRFPEGWRIVAGHISELSG